MQRSSWVVLFVLLTVAASTLGAQVSVTARFAPSTISVGATGVYEVIVEGSQVKPSGSIQAPSGLRLNEIGSSINTQIRNFEVFIQVTYRYAVTADAPGEYTIPAWRATVGSQTFTVPAATLTVTDRRRSPSTTDTADTPWLTYELPEGNHYVGQAMLVQVHLYVPEVYGVRRELPHLRDMDDAPTKTGDAFQLEPFPLLNEAQASRGFENPRYFTQHEEEINGKTFYRLTWETLLIPLKSGEQDLSFSINTLIATSSGRPSPFDMFGGSPFFEQTQRVPLHTEATKATILPLPRNPEPGLFTGAIGSFRLIEPELDRGSAQVGEPLTLTVEIEGAGNFDRIEPPVLENKDGWQVRPDLSGEFTPTDAIGYEGRKRFQYTLIPGREDLQEAPRVVFNYLDPESGEYTTLRSRPLAVTITPAPEGALRYARTPAVQEPAQAPKTPQLLDNLSTAGRWVGAIEPPFFKPVFVTVNLLLLALLAGCAFLLRQRHRLRHNAAYARQRACRAALREHLQQAQTKAASQDATGFYAALTRALQAAGGLHLTKAPEAITADELQTLLDRNPKATPEDKLQLRTLLQAGDAVKFSGQKPDVTLYNTHLSEAKNLCRLLEEAPAQ